ncbi:putative nucleic acid-binding protein, contains PIN domain [Geoglobus ahangari]|uniref:Ribonuclease VapC n=1 Tax=Geoglobus ahangari TaxID=113653 RepID=A0A0F7IDU9_9EURY|nr:type II toxin-antitoxin system VapC family toxin [Geoglobus ahangari]AKG91090.1 putative nucleic acid-binding protein, contains PIN domain [Geoglobus ahangari]
MKLLLDTSFLIELKKRNKKAIRALEERKNACEDLLVSAITVYELMVGAKFVWKKHGDAKEFIKIGEMLKALTKVPVDEKVVERAAEVRATLMLKGIDVPDIDILIACSDPDCEVLTFDRDFEKLKEVGIKVTVLDR